MPPTNPHPQLQPAPLVSVLLPIRDAEDTLEAALNSVRASSLENLELVCVDDGSSDATPDILARAAGDDGRVRVLRQPPLGLVPALNHGLEHCRCEFVARMDADDEMDPKRLELQLGALREDPQLALVGCQVESFREGGLLGGYEIYSEWVNQLLSHEAMRRECFVECPVPHPTWMFRGDRVRALGGYRDVDWPEDLDLLYRLLDAGERLGKLSLPLHRWRDHDTRLSRTDPRYSREAFARAKAHYVGRLFPLRAAVIWGAGRTGKRFSRLLAAEGIRTHAFIDIRPDRQGNAWHQIPILGPDAAPEKLSGWLAAEMRILAAVSSRGARDEIRRALTAWELREGEAFLIVA